MNQLEKERDIEFVLQREVFQPTYTLGHLYKEGDHFAYTCEDKDRELENGGVKIKGVTAIPKGRYHLTATMSQRFSRVMPLIVDVPGFEGIRIHGGNTDRDTEGCPLIGAIRTAEGVAGCKEIVAKLIKTIVDAQLAGKHCWITIK